jgi:hypothetical protein
LRDDRSEPALESEQGDDSRLLFVAGLDREPVRACLLEGPDDRHDSRVRWFERTALAVRRHRIAGRPHAGAHAPKRVGVAVFRDGIEPDAGIVPVEADERAVQPKTLERVLITEDGTETGGDNRGRLRPPHRLGAGDGDHMTLHARAPERGRKCADV